MAILLSAVLSSSSWAQQTAFVGPAQCTGCHQHQEARQWAEKLDGDGRGKRHLNSLNQLEDARAAAWGRAIGLGDVYDTKGSCVGCHGTVVKGSVDVGVSCESCHGGGRDYLKPHQEKGAYQTAVSLGMKDSVRKPEVWVRQCLSCHVLGANPKESALVAAGHPSGKDFDLAAKFSTVALHFSSKYAPAQIASLAATARGQGAPSRAAAPAPAPAVPVAVAPPPGATTAQPPPTRAPTAGIPPVAAPRGSPVTTQPPVAATPLPARAVPAQAAPSQPARSAAAAQPAPEAEPQQLEPGRSSLPRDQGSPSQLAGAAQGKVVEVLTALLRQGAQPPARFQALAPVKYLGVDSSLLQLQREVISLGIEALAIDPAAKK